jgi:DNA-binding transcriptional ArsR family regulator
MTAPEPLRRLRGSGELTALAHPVRLGILEALTIRGPQTATELAEELDESPANCSWHLRKLAEHGFVEEAERGPGRRRPWKISSIGLSFDTNEGTPEDVRAGLALADMFLQRSVARLRESQRRLPEEPQAWRQASNTSESATWLTAEELEQRNAEITEILMRDADRLTDASKRPPGARLCELVAWGVPVQMKGDDTQSEGDTK